MTRRLFQHSAMMQNTSQVAVRHIRIDAAFFHHLQAVHREKAAVGTHLSQWLATLVLPAVHDRHQQPVVVQFPADLLGHDQMIVAHGQRHRVAQRESRAFRQKRLSAPMSCSSRPGTGHPQRVGVQPHLQQQRWMMGRMPFLAIACFKLSLIQLLHRTMNEKAKISLSQYFSYFGW